MERTHAWLAPFNLVNLLAVALALCAPSRSLGQADPSDAATSTAGDADKPKPAYLPSIPKARLKVSSADLDSSSALGSEQELVAQLEARARYLRKGDVAKAEVELTNLIELGRALHVRNMPLVSAALMHEARQALSQPAAIPVSALLAAKAATQLSPDLVDAHFLRARLLTKFSSSELPNAAVSVVQGVRAMFGSIRNRVALITTLVGVLLSTLLAMVLVYAVVELSRHVRFIGHDIVRGLPDWISGFQGALFIVLVLIAPFVLGFGIVPTLVLILAVLIPYQEMKERVVSGVFIGLMALFPFAVQSVAPLMAFFGSPTDALITAAGEGFSDEAEARLIALAQKGRVDHDVSVVLGLRARQRGDLAAAENWYRSAIAANGQSVLAKNNLAKLLYARREQDEAKRLFDEAKQGGRAEPLLNLATLELDFSRFDAANRLIDQARSIDAAVTRRYNDVSSGGSTAERLLEIPFDESSLWPRVVAGDPQRNGHIAAQLWSYLGGRTPADYLSIACLVLAGLGFALGQKKKELALSAPCAKCGRPANPFVAKQLCDQCRTIFLKAVAVDPSTRERKEKKIRFYQRRLRWTERLLSVLPGAGDIFGGRTLTGITFLFFFALGLTAVTWVNRMSFHPWSVGPVHLPVGVVAFVAFVEVILALVCVRRAFR